MASEPRESEGVLRAALIQENPVPGDLEANVELVRAALAGLEGPADLAVFPELFLSGYRTEGIDALAIGAGDASVEKLRRIAAAERTALIVGAPERTEDGVADAALCIDPGGELVAIRRKGHLFGDERRAFRAGEQLAPVRLGTWSVGVLVCFDLEFPEAARTLALAGADVLVTIAANMEPFEPDHDLFARARALENGLPHLYVNRTGSESGHDFVGASQALDADARVLARAGAEPARLLASVPLGARRDPRLRYLDLRRPGLYRSGAAAVPAAEPAAEGPVATRGGRA